MYNETIDAIKRENVHEVCTVYFYFKIKYVKGRIF